MAPSATEKAQAKFFAILEDPRRYDSSNSKNRVMITRTPSSGSDLTNNMTGRRGSASSQGSATDQHHLRNRLKTWLYPGAV
ncbi:hypothetical protein CPAR01_00783 [Colletotrichum paranaense]|uniref:Uncharacterized protein n=6 Tax=Colletotrichum acutatum species complex TaxID=2707335 RepID=A0A9P9XQ07_9PEZI|nr:uncharacterized protein CLUP02_14245 [Colletotrichum lupini]XP_060306697.1 uncharacterized protein CCOS01_14723 [Colletotrichum costaricense]XP_060355930.1 uncharacterized protein CPAR01_00783 [Colletotrichum paranaense]XP_060382707.1 uncharacterized protein CTAM01_06421 [Colletotrichum tamarilloi]XP_060402598.1 uncharacterized protein CABS01_07736 [Colletotrichum abscissum]KAI3546384.1 hypothetical protein CSPX01_04463 [Colletotrichum filicis]KAK1455712.1 hypothetical protein CMEL01_04472